MRVNCCGSIQSFMRHPVKVVLGIVAIAVFAEAIRRGILGSGTSLANRLATPLSSSVEYLGPIAQLHPGWPKGLDKMPMDHCFNSLHDAIASKNLIGMKKEIDAGAGIETKSCIGETPLHLTIDERFPEGAALLIEKGADIENPRRTSDLPENWPNKADPEREDFSPSPLLYAMQMNSKETMKVLVKAGAKVFDPPCCSPFKKAINYATNNNDLIFLKILTQTDSHPAFASCNSLDEFLDVLFKKPDMEKIRSELQLKAGSLLVSKLSAIPVASLPEREFTDGKDLIAFLQDQNPRFKIAWDEVVDTEKEHIKNSIQRFLPFKTSDIQLLYQWVARALTDETYSFYERMCLGEMGLDEVLTQNSIANFYLYLAEIISGSNLSIEKFISQNPQLPTQSDIEYLRSRWKDNAAVLFFATHQDWLSKRIEELRTPSQL